MYSYKSCSPVEIVVANWSYLFVLFSTYNIIYLYKNDNDDSQRRKRLEDRKKFLTEKRIEEDQILDTIESEQAALIEERKRELERKREMLERRKRSLRDQRQQDKVHESFELDQKIEER